MSRRERMVRILELVMQRRWSPQAFILLHYLDCRTSMR